jgi:Icc-related predicted phosphoesterase
MVFSYTGHDRSNWHRDDILNSKCEPNQDLNSNCNPSGGRQPSLRSLRLAAVGDLHLTGSEKESDQVRQTLAILRGQAEVLLICGDLTAHGRPDEIRAIVEGVADFDGTVITVLGNHDHESDCSIELTRMLQSVGIIVLDGDCAIVGDVGFAGVKGFGGGFGSEHVEAFGERALKSFVRASSAEADKLDRALRQLRTPKKVVLTHYSPVTDTLVGEPETIWAFLGSSWLADALDRHQVSAAFHGHAHLGRPEGRTTGGTPVFNVSVPVLRREGLKYRFWSVEALEHVYRPGC